MPNNHADTQPRSASGKFVKAEVPAPDALDPAPEGQELNITELEPYRELAAQLKEAFDRIKAINEEQAFLAQARATALQRQSELETAWIETSSEESVSELAKLGSRVHLFDVKAKSLESKLAEAHAALRERLFVFDRSFHALGLYLESFLVAGGCDRILERVDPSCKIEAKSYALDLARMSVEAVRARNAQIRIEAVNETTAPEIIFAAADRALPKVEALLGLALEQIVPSPVFTLADWQANMRKSVEQLEAERKGREERDRKARADALARFNSVDLGPVATYSDTGSPGIVVGPEAWHAAHPEGVQTP